MREVLPPYPTRYPAPPPLLTPHPQSLVPPSLRPNLPIYNPLTSALRLKYKHDVSSHIQNRRSLHVKVFMRVLFKSFISSLPACYSGTQGVPRHSWSKRAQNGTGLQNCICLRPCCSENRHLSASAPSFSVAGHPLLLLVLVQSFLAGWCGRCPAAATSSLHPISHRLFPPPLV